VGKTQLVLDYVQQHRNDYKEESPERDFGRLYQTLFSLHASAGAETISVEEAVRSKELVCGSARPMTDGVRRR
jgi:hypothetical protein